MISCKPFFFAIVGTLFIVANSVVLAEDRQAAIEKSDQEQSLHTLSPGMSKTEVALRCGQPLQKVEQEVSHKQIWEYPSRALVFQDGRLLLPEQEAPTSASETDRTSRKLIGKLNEPYKKRTVVMFQDIMREIPSEPDGAQPAVPGSPSGNAGPMEIRPGLRPQVPPPPMADDED